MLIHTIDIEGVFIIEPRVHGDERGYFMESYNRELLVAAGITNDFVQDNEAYSTKGVLRGLHYQTGQYAQAKLVRVVAGEVLDVIVDIRPESPTYGKHFTVHLSSNNKKQMLVPRGMAHGYIVLSDTAIFAYKCDNGYQQSAEGGLKYDDPQLNINWILDKSLYSVSEKDMDLPYLGNHIAINL